MFGNLVFANQFLYMKSSLKRRFLSSVQGIACTSNVGSLQCSHKTGIETSWVALSPVQPLHTTFFQNYLYFPPNHKARWYTCKFQDSYLGAARFQSRPVLRILVVFISPCRQFFGKIPSLRHDWFLPNAFHYIAHQLSYHSTLYTLHTGSVVKQPASLAK